MDGERCIICDEFVPMHAIEAGEGAEMHNPNDPEEGGFCHATCGVNAGWEVS
jgi:heterodisulfide reductase subunit A-like polyferredoxin